MGLFGIIKKIFKPKPLNVGEDKEIERMRHEHIEREIEHSEPKPERDRHDHIDPSNRHDRMA